MKSITKFLTAPGECMPSLTEIRQNCLERAKMESSDFCRSVMVGAVWKTKQQYMGETGNGKAEAGKEPGFESGHRKDPPCGRRAAFRWQSTPC